MLRRSFTTVPGTVTISGKPGPARVMATFPYFACK
jgi:hypothetical protein